MGIRERECIPGRHPWDASMECIPGMHPWNASLECIPGMHPWKVSQEYTHGMHPWKSLECNPGMHPWNASLECTLGMCPCNAPLECIPGMHILRAWTIVIGLASGVAWVILKIFYFICFNKQQVRFQRLGHRRYCRGIVGTVAVLSRYCRGTVAVLSVLSQYCRGTVVVLSRTNLIDAIAGKLDFPNLGLTILDKSGCRARVVRAHCFC